MSDTSARRTTSRNRHKVSTLTFLVVQLLFAVSIVGSWLILSTSQQSVVAARAMHRSVELDLQVDEIPPVRVEPFYDDSDVVSEAELAAVLRKILPRFSRRHLRPNYVEHALRTWGAEIEFTNPDIISGPQMRDFLFDNSQYVDSWGADGMPILEPADGGISIRFAADRTSSVHHDHLLACMTEAGVPLNLTVHAPGQTMQMHDILNQALHDFQLDEQETEWSAMAFGLWLMPQQKTTWHNGQGREITLDMLAERLMRNHKRHGVCTGTHRVYTMMLMIRLNEEQGGKLLSEQSVTAMTAYLADVRDLIIAAQNDDGSWPPNWAFGARAQELTDPGEQLYRTVIATGHHLEWLAIAPQELHPPRESILKAADWIIRNTLETPQATIDANYTFYSHVGNALALWRHTHPAEFWARWRIEHPECEHFSEEEIAPANLAPPSPGH